MPASARPSADPRSEPTGSRALVTVLAVAGVVVSLQQTVVIPLVPRLPVLLGATAEDAAWVVTATLLAGAVATPIVGRIADMVGKRKMLLVCLVVLVAGSVVVALSSTLVPFVVGRALQGLAAGVVPLGISLMRDQLPAERLASTTAVMSASLGIGGALGLPLSALVVQSLPVATLFWGSAALGALVAVLVALLVRESPQRSGGRFDALGGVLLSAALVCLFLPLSKAATWGWASSATLLLLVGFVASMTAFVTWELRIGDPLVDLRTSGRRQVLLTNAASLIFGFAMFAMSLAFPQLLQLPASTGYGLGRSVLVAGLVLAPGGLCMMVVSPLSARLSRASGPRTTLLLGALVVAAGYVLAAVLHAAVWQLVLSSVVISCGVALAYGAMPALIMAAVPPSQTAAANGLNNLMRAIGTSSASAVTGAVLTQLSVGTGAGAHPSERAFVLVILLGAGAALAAAAITSAVPRRSRARQDPAVAAGAGASV